MADIYIGLMSGTSLDGVDGVVADFSATRATVLAHAQAPFSEPLRTAFLALNASGPDELHRAALAANGLARLYGQVVHDLLAQSGLTATQIAAIGAHGQTVRHQPQMHDATGYTVQINNPALLAELTGIDVVADLRSRDVAAGGQGAPLAPFFHQAWFGRAHQTVAVLNLGGIANLTLLRADGSMIGFDCGPANTLLDIWCERHTGARFDLNGTWAASGNVQPSLLAAMLAHPYFALAPPKSTGRDLFNQAWLTQCLDTPGVLAAEDVQATLAQLTAQTCAQALLHHGTASELVVCGGGAFNADLMQRLQILLPGIAVQSSAAYGLDPQQVEATAFAWLARKCVRREPLALEKITGAKGTRVLGCMYPR